MLSVLITISKTNAVTKVLIAFHCQGLPPVLPEVALVMQVLPTLPLHDDAPFKIYEPVATPQYSVDFVTLEPMQPQVNVFSKQS